MYVCINILVCILFPVGKPAISNDIYFNIDFDYIHICYVFTIYLY